MRSPALLLALLALLAATAAPTRAGTLPAVAPATVRSALSSPDQADVHTRSYSWGSGDTPAPASSSDYHPPASNGGAGLSPDAEEDCEEAFLAWLETSSSCYGTKDQCCEPFLELGEACWEHILQAVSSDQEMLDKLIDLYGSCGVTVTTSDQEGGSGHLTEEECIDAYNAAIDGGCSEDGSADDCCAALGSLGAECRNLIIVLQTADPEYSDSLRALTATLEECGLTSSDDTDADGSGLTGECASSFLDALQGSCASGASLSGCCAAVDAVGEACLEEIAFASNEYPDAQKALVALLESCGWTITYDESRSALARTPAPHSALAAAAAALTSAVKPRSGRSTGEQLPLLGHGVRLAGKH